ncbi:lysylphosphatidylglycerol synthase transmembrane domain-containing protein [Candidatus Scalindua japonica]|uniref:lysylphosphatidylglycerol synthase transmembrane domain-containing protein n=1 Tax=Candidatus Scalindua japonica TaxID=1284222 RepID=UPI0013A53BBB|nr:lysylphosphatidylglycerol synthase transmembrane domain-containing protein [Candidatus Scalindua japonica]
MKPHKKRILFIAGILISFICSWLFVRKIEWTSLGMAFREARYIYIFPTIIILFVNYYLRAIRWEVLLSPVKKISIVNLFSVVVIGFMANNLLPARLGEVIRPAMIARKEKIKISTLFATIVMERIFDVLGIIVIASLLFYFLPSETDSQSIIHQLKKWSVIMAFFGICAITSMFLLSLYPEKAGAVFEKMLFVFPHNLRDTLVNLLHSFVSGLQIFDHKTKLIWVGILSLIIWFFNAASVYVLCYSFSIGLSFAGACFVIVCLALAVALPQAPGFIGVFHIATQKSLNVFDVSISSAQSFAILLWAISVIPVTIAGLLFLWREGMSLREISHYDEENIPE